jgi:hypothetical protein
MAQFLYTWSGGGRVAKIVGAELTEHGWPVTATTET